MGLAEYQQRSIEDVSLASLSYPGPWSELGSCEFCWRHTSLPGPIVPLWLLTWYDPSGCLGGGPSVSGAGVRQEEGRQFDALRWVQSAGCTVGDAS